MSHALGFIVWFWLNVFWVCAFPVILYLRAVHHRRLLRGVIHRFFIRCWGPLGYVFAHIFMWMLLMAALISAFAGLEKAADYEFAMYWTIWFVWLVIDYITGGDDPGRRIRKLAKDLAKKLAFAPAPRPVIDLRMNTCSTH